MQLARDQQKAFRKQNEINCRKSVEQPELHRTRSSTPVTVPKEFNLSVSNSSARSRSQSVESEGGDQGGCRQRKERPGSWKPQLTAPGQRLQLAKRPQSSGHLRGAHRTQAAPARSEAELQEWVRQASSGEERAQRERVAEQELLDQRLAKEKSRLFVFDRNAGRLPRQGLR